MNARKGFDISLTVVIAILLVMVLVAFLGTIATNYADQFLEFGKNNTDVSLEGITVILGGLQIERNR